MVNTKHTKQTKQRRLAAKEARKPSMVFRKIDPIKLKQRGERRGGSFDTIFKPGVDTYRPKQGDNCFRILPPTWSDADHFGYTVWVHAWIGGTSGTYLCPLKMKSKSCPICLEAQQARKAGEEDESRKLEPREQTVYYVIDRQAKDDLPKLYAAGWTIDRDICSRCTDKRSGATLYIYHPTEGYDIFARRVGEGLLTKYIIEIDRTTSPICEDEKTQESVLEQVEATPIPSLLAYKDEKYLKNVLEGAIKDKDEDLDEEEDEGEAQEEEKEVDDEETAQAEDDTDETEDDESEDESDEEDQESDEEDSEEDGDEEEGDENGDEEDSDEDDEEEDEPVAATKRRNGPERIVKKEKKESRIPRRREREERATRSRR